MALFFAQDDHQCKQTAANSHRWTTDMAGDIIDVDLVKIWCEADNGHSFGEVNQQSA